MSINKGLCFILLSVVLTSCSQTTLEMDDTNFKNLPKVRKTNLSAALSCATKKMKVVYLKKGFIYILSNVEDGTVRPKSYQDGLLSDTGKIELTNSLLRVVNSTQGIILNRIPPMMDSNMSPYGGTNFQKIQIMELEYKNLINGVRGEVKLPPLDKLSSLVVDAVFTRNDSEPIYKNGNAFNGGVSSQQPVTGSVDFGQTNKTKGITLVITISNPITNQVIASKAFTAYSFESDNQFKIRLGYQGGYIGFNHEDIVVQSTHGIQQALIDTAALWLANATYGQNNGLNFNTCLDSTEELKENLL